MLLRICVGMLCLAVTAIAQNDTDLPMAGDPIEERFEGAASVRSLHFYVCETKVMGIPITYSQGL